ncbi:hypothetical protein MAR_005137 [Mya arenaria]|uniref:Uncharacterized protein n=1 Tax=Mya arenaria TaxID=6604 RepID=A0ABY7F0B1_MYAAR|nr:hypothetical protein MAR_005137 [Mya arenaria]
MHDEDSSDKLMYFVDHWLALDKVDGSICRGLPAVRKGTPSLPVLRYVVAVTTGSWMLEWTVQIFILNLIGVDGDIGLREGTSLEPFLKVDSLGSLDKLTYSLLKPFLLGKK